MHICYHSWQATSIQRFIETYIHAIKHIENVQVTVPCNMCVHRVTRSRKHLTVDGVKFSMFVTDSNYLSWTNKCEAQREVKKNYPFPF